MERGSICHFVEFGDDQAGPCTGCFWLDDAPGRDCLAPDDCPCTFHDGTTGIWTIEQPVTEEVK